MLRLSQIGHVGAAPELRFTPGGDPVASVRVATTDRWTGDDGEIKERTTWVRWECWGKSGENLAKLVKKGSQVYIEGGLRNDSFEKDGVKQYRDRHVVEYWRLLDRKEDASTAQADPSAGDGNSADGAGAGGMASNPEAPPAETPTQTGQGSGKKKAAKNA